MAIDLTQFHEVFYEESLEGVDQMEQALVSLGDDADPETINLIFRAAHSIKGGSATFGFNNIADFTHVMETLLDEAREGKRELDQDCVDLLLKSCDCLQSMVLALREGSEANEEEASQLIAAIERKLAGDDSADHTANEPNFDAPTLETTDAPDGDHESSSGTQADSVSTFVDEIEPAHHSLEDGREQRAFITENDEPNDKSKDFRTNNSGSFWRITFNPEPQILKTGNEPLRIFRALTTLGRLSVVANIDEVPRFDALQADECYMSWILELCGQVQRDEILEVFDWVLDDCELSIELVDQQLTKAEQELSSNNTENKKSDKVAANKEVAIEPKTIIPERAANDSDAKTSKREQAAASQGSSIRVGIDKVDSLINLVGELVITQSMLSELGSNFSPDKIERLAEGLEQLKQNTKELHESVLRVRMLPISFAFNRLPRMVRDLASKTDKLVDLQLIGEQTELDKTIMEKISDPMLHLVRNAVDHGIESPECRIERGKPTAGTVQLSAYHQGGSIVVEICDDGAGIDPEIILAKAIEKGIADRQEHLTESQIFELIFEPGFSTSETVSDISGRGVGMDVVKKNIKELGGRVEIASQLGKGSTFKIYLPLTLAIMDGQLIRVGDQTFVIPLLSIVESLLIEEQQVSLAAGNIPLYRRLEENIPIIKIYEEFAIETNKRDLGNGLLVIVEGDGQKVGLFVDELLAQQQVVIKNLETNYRRVLGVSGATILGDGSVSLILDIPGLMQLASTSSANDSSQAKTHAA